MLVWLGWPLGCSATAQRDDDVLADERAQRCVREHPASQAEMDAALDASNAIGDCVSDDGMCQASSECVGAVEDRVCEPKAVLGIDAAECVALAAGLSSGLHGLQASLTYHFGQRRIVWNVRNVTSESPGGGSRGEGLTIDAVTGELLDSFGWSATP